jgi:hypothetical protein
MFLNSGVSLTFRVTPLSLSVIFWRIGMMDCWNSGIMGIKIGNNRFFVFFTIIPVFHYSNIPVGMFQLWQSPSSFCMVNGLQEYFWSGHLPDLRCYCLMLINAYIPANPKRAWGAKAES